jgi:cell division transport system permease protein
MTTLERAARGTLNDWRIYALSVFSVAVAFVCLAMAALVVVNLRGIQSRWADMGHISVYLKPSATRERLTEIEVALKRTPGVTAVRYLSSDEARTDLVGRLDDEALAALPPEAFPASIELDIEKSLRSEDLGRLSERIQTLPDVEGTESYGAWTDRIDRLLGAAVTIALLLGIVVLAAVVSVVSSTSRLALERRRIEIDILRLIGATDRYVVRPFVVEGAAQGAVGAALAIAFVGILYALGRSELASGFGTWVGSSPLFLPLSLIGALVSAGGLFGAGAALVSMRRLATR